MTSQGGGSNEDYRRFVRKPPVVPLGGGRISDINVAHCEDPLWSPLEGDGFLQ